MTDGCDVCIPLQPGPGSVQVGKELLGLPGLQRMQFSSIIQNEREYPCAVPA